MNRLMRNVGKPASEWYDTAGSSRSVSSPHWNWREGQGVDDWFVAIFEEWAKHEEPAVSSLPVEQLRCWVRGVVRRLEQVKMDEGQGQNCEPDIVAQVQAYIQSNLSEDVSLQRLSERVFLHPVYLSRLYKAKTGERLRDYILRVKMERASELLLSGKDYKVADIAAETGFTNTSHFSKVFKQRFKLTPLEYRKRYAH